MAPVCLAHGLELVDVRFRQERGRVLRVIVERLRANGQAQSGVSLSDCQAVSRDLSTLMDVNEDVAPAGSYRLEVSSPGLERPLFKVRDYLRFQGREVKIQTRTRVQERRRFQGWLVGVQGDEVVIEQDGMTVGIPFAEIAKANLVYRF